MVIKIKLNINRMENIVQKKKIRFLFPTIQIGMIIGWFNDLLFAEYD